MNVSSVCRLSMGRTPTTAADSPFRHDDWTDVGVGGVVASLSLKYQPDEEQSDPGT
jgi:hypothetical protein